MTSFARFSSLEMAQVTDRHWWRRGATKPWRNCGAETFLGCFARSKRARCATRVEVSAAPSEAESGPTKQQPAESSYSS